MAASERMRLMAVAKRAAKAASLQSPLSAAPSHPAYALPVNGSGMFDSLREEDMSQDLVPDRSGMSHSLRERGMSQDLVPDSRCTSCGAQCHHGLSSMTSIAKPLINANFGNSSPEARKIDTFEAFCADDSSIGKIAPRFGVNVSRLTLETCNLGTKSGTKLALAQIRANAGASMHSSLPCTPWSTWNHMNSHKYGKAFTDKLESKRAQSLIMLNSFI